MAAYETYETEAVYDEMDYNPTVKKVSFLCAIFKSDFYWQAPEPAPPRPKEEPPPPKRENENGNSKVH